MGNMVTASVSPSSERILPLQIPLSNYLFPKQLLLISIIRKIMRFQLLIVFLPKG